MMKFSRRRIQNIIVTLIICSVILLGYHLLSMTLTTHSRFTGWLLIVFTGFLASYNIRKRLSFLPIGSSASWLQMHLYVGLIALFVFLLHIEFRIPNGLLEFSLAAVVLLLMTSGFGGIFISRFFAKRLATTGEEIIFERIPIFIRNIQEETEGLVSQSITDEKSSSIATLYSQHLHHYFCKPRYLLHHLAGSDRPLIAIQGKVNAIERYLNKAEQKIADDIIELIKTKYNLDYHFAHQAILKLWLFIHIPLSYILILLSILHVILVYVYSGGSL